MNKIALLRWHQNKPFSDESELLLTARLFKKYKYSIYTMQRSALKIQHWFFKKVHLSA
jgi:hypothetical protein